MTTIRRRDLLRAGGLSVLALGLPAGFLRRAFAQEGATPSLVVIYLRGGMDALHFLVPYGDRRYHDYRPTLAIAPEGTKDRPAVVALDDEFGLHPALASLKPLWDAGRLAPVVNSGSPHTTRSHFDAQDFMEYAAPGMRTIRDGWLNRYLAASRREAAPEERLRALAMQELLPRALRGVEPAVAVPDQDLLEDRAILDAFQGIYDEARTEEAEATSEIRRTGRDTARHLGRLREIARAPAPGEGAYPPGPLAAKLRAIARTIRAGVGLEIAALDVQGWDTHANEGGDAGTMPTLMRSLADGLAAFVKDLGPHADRTLVLVMTEFGRTCRENGNYGTDHGHGGLMLLVGPGLKGRRVHGAWTGLAEKDLYEGRDLKVTTDFRDVFAEALRHHFRFKAPADFFPGYRPRPVRGLFA